MQLGANTQDLAIETALGHAHKVGLFLIRRGHTLPNEWIAELTGAGSQGKGLDNQLQANNRLREHLLNRQFGALANSFEVV